ncbi:MAG: Ig-like domain-containing protein, partial [Desulfobulbaceae bacterium]|nr:Ig-like domain-containing protein [Desulfobulbaceae bacterium]
SIDVAGSDLAADPDATINASFVATDAAGNTAAPVTDTEGYSVDTTAAATITVDPITADDIINASEAGGTVAVTGTVGGDAASGDTVSFTVNGTPYNGTVNPDNITWSINVAGSDLAADTSFDATVSGTDGAGNSFSATTTSTHSVSVIGSASIVVDPITADDVVNASEAGGSVNVSGTVGGDAASGDTVSFTVNGTPYNGTVNPDNTTWTISVSGADLAADTSFDATVSGTDGVGNPFSATTTSTHSVDTTAIATITLDANITADDIINASEAGGTVAIEGDVAGDFQTGDI